MYAWHTVGRLNMWRSESNCLPLLLSLPHTLGQNSGCHACTGRDFIHRTISLVPLTSLSFLNAAEDRM